jgi:hypothetical protein
MKKYDIVAEATALVDDQLELLRALYLAKQTMADGKSRLVCRCGSCRSHRQITLGWVENFLGLNVTAAPATSQVAAGAPATSDAPRTSN